MTSMNGWLLLAMFALVARFFVVLMIGMRTGE